MKQISILVATLGALAAAMLSGCEATAPGDSDGVASTEQAMGTASAVRAVRTNNSSGGTEVDSSSVSQVNQYARSWNLPLQIFDTIPLGETSGSVTVMHANGMQTYTVNNIASSNSIYFPGATSFYIRFENSQWKAWRQDGSFTNTIYFRKVSQICTNWTNARTNLSEGVWNGNVNTCNAGTPSSDARDTALRLVNLYRSFAGLPDVTMDDTYNDNAQQCALVMRANGNITHTPPDDYKCWTQTAYDTAYRSVISTSGAVRAVDLYMLDAGEFNAPMLGHRRWVLSNQLGPVGIGSTGNTYSCMQVVGGTGNANKSWTAWPPEGLVPIEALWPTGTKGVDSTGWSIQSDTIDLAGATVTVTANGRNMPVTVTQLTAGYGSKYALRFNPIGWGVAPSVTYRVTVNGVTPEIAYDVTVVECQ